MTWILWAIGMSVCFAVGAYAQPAKLQRAFANAEKIPIENVASDVGEPRLAMDILLLNSTSEEITYRFSSYFEAKPEEFRIGPGASHSLRYSSRARWENPFVSYFHKRGGDQIAVEKILPNRRLIEFRESAVGATAVDAGPLIYEVTVINRTNQKVNLYRANCSSDSWKSGPVSDGGSKLTLDFAPEAECDTPKVSFWTETFFYRSYPVAFAGEYELTLGSDRRFRLDPLPHK